MLKCTLNRRPSQSECRTGLKQSRTEWLSVIDLSVTLQTCCRLSCDLGDKTATSSWQAH